MPIAPRASNTIPIRMGIIPIRPKLGAAGAGALGKAGGGDEKDEPTARNTIPTMMAKMPPIICCVGLVPIMAFEVPGGGCGTTMTLLTGLEPKPNPQLEQNWAPGTYAVPHRVQTDNVAGNRNHDSRLKILDATREAC